MKEKDSSTEEAQPATSEPIQKKKSNTWKLLLLIPVGIAGLIISAVFLFNAATSGAITASDQFVKYVQEDNASGAYALFSAEAKADTTLEELSQATERVSSILDGELSKNGTSIEGGTNERATSKISYEIDGSDGVTYDLTVNLIKEEGAWKVISFDSVGRE